MNKLHKYTNSNDPEIIKNYDLKKEIESHNSQYLLYKYILTLAVIYENIVFYLPNFIDFRGRIYCLVYFLSYQVSDIARGLIEFADGSPLDKKGFDIALHGSYISGKICL